MSEINIVDAPPGTEGPGYFATSLDKVIGLAAQILYGRCRSQLLAVESNLWLPWVLTTI